MFSLRTGALLLALGSLGAQAPSTPAPYTVFSAEGRRPLPTRLISSQEMFALDDLTKLFELTVREDNLAGGLTVTARAQIDRPDAGQSLASVAGRLISLPAPPARDGRSWFVPVDFVPRALAPALGIPVELRKPSRMILVGGVRVPRVASSLEALGALARLTLDVAPQTPHTVAQDGSRLVIKFEADALDAALPPVSAPDLIQSSRMATAPSLIARPRPAIRVVPHVGSARRSRQRTNHRRRHHADDRCAAAGDGRAATPPVTPPAAPTSPPPLLDLAPSGGIRTIVVDAGHGGTEDGAHGPGGTLEKHVTLSVARRLKAALEARLGVRVILTRDADATVELDERAALANNNKADLFVSLHANASVRASAAGAEVFYLSLEEYGDQAQRVARGETEALPVFGGGTRDIEVILWEMAQARYIEESAVLAKEVEAGAARARADEPARDSAGAVPRAGRREHAGRARRDGLHHATRTRKSSCRRSPSRLRSSRPSSTALPDTGTNCRPASPLAPRPHLRVRAAAPP